MTGARLGVLGGTFDPIHIGHLVIADAAMEVLGLERVLFVPAGSPPHKIGVNVSPVEHRLEMVERAIRDRPEFELSDIDATRSEPAYTFELLERIGRDHPATELWFIMGADSLIDFPTWVQPQRILELASLAVAARPGFLVDDQVLKSMRGLAERVTMIDAPLCDVSSTLLRERITAGLPVRYVVPASVLEFINETRLYRFGEPASTHMPPE